MTWPDFYLICFLLGFGFQPGFAGAGSLAASALAGHPLPRHFSTSATWGRRRGPRPRRFAVQPGHLHGLPGVVRRHGYLLSHYYGVWYLAALGVAFVSGVGGAAIVFWFLFKVLISKEENLDPADYDMVGVLGPRDIPIRRGGTGEIVFLLPYLPPIFINF